jgi:dipeptidase E
VAHPVSVVPGQLNEVPADSPSPPDTTEEITADELGVLELTALPSIERSIWIETDALLVGGGDPLYLCYWIEQSGLRDLLPSLSNMVWVGVSAGSLVMGPQVGQGFVSGSPVTTGDDRALGLVDFAMFPHLNHEAMPDHSMAAAELWAAGLTVPAYAIDDETAIKVVGPTVEVVSEGKWQLFNARANAGEVS